MYEFRDVKDATSTLRRGAEALKINGIYIETLIPQYRTLAVSGREGLSKEIESVEIGASDGSSFLRKKYPSRVITVKYLLKCANAQEFREAYNKLAKMLDVENAELIFDDEPDKFFIGTPEEVEDVEPGRNEVVGEFSILCNNPFKFSTKETVVEPDISDGMLHVDYKGTYKSYPTLVSSFFTEEGEELTGDGDCGYVGFANQNGGVLQFGDPEEVDQVTVPPKSSTIFNYSFVKSDAYSPYVKSHWTLNTAKTESSLVTQEGDFHVAVNRVVKGNFYYLTPAKFGTSPKWHGPSLSRVLRVPSQYFKLTWKQSMAIGKEKTDTKQLGQFQMLIYSGQGAERKILAGISIFKNKVGKKANLRYFANDKIIKTEDIDLSYGNIPLSHLTESRIEKDKNGIKFRVGKHSLNLNSPELDAIQATEVAFVIGKWGTSPALAHNGLYRVKFVKNNAEYIKDVPNKFSSNDELVIDCAQGKAYLNGTTADGLGALGNDWEDFYLEPGINEIAYGYSDWLDDVHKPKVQLRYREVFI